jgi:hypothetical protein
MLVVGPLFENGKGGDGLLERERERGRCVQLSAAGAVHQSIKLVSSGCTISRVVADLNSSSQLSGLCFLVKKSLSRKT